MLAIAMSVALALVPGETWFVDASNAQCDAANGSFAKPFCTIAAALGPAADGDTIRIAPGTYFESLLIDEDLTLVGTGGAAVTILDGRDLFRPIETTDGTHVVLRGLTLQHGRDSNGGAIMTPGLLLPTTLLIDACVLQNNRAFSTVALGGAIFASRTDLTIVDTVLTGNVAGADPSSTDDDAFGGAIYLSSLSLTMRRCVVSGNRLAAGGKTVGGGLNTSAANVLIEDSEVSANSAEGETSFGGGISSISGGTQGLTLVRSRVHGNTAETGGGIYSVTPVVLDGVELSQDRATGSASELFVTDHPCTIRSSTIVGDQPPRLIHVGPRAPVSMDNSILWGDASGLDPIRGDPAALAASVVNHSNVVGGWSGSGVGNLSVAPSFVDLPNADLRLLATSPCIDAGDPSFASNELDRLGAPRVLDGDLNRSLRVDMGAYEFANATLDVAGVPAAGNTLTASVDGTAGLTAFLGIGAPSATPLSVAPFGTLFFETGASSLVYGVGVLPTSLDLPLPPTLVGPLTVTFQAIAFGITPVNGRLPGNVSNPVTLTIL